MHWTANNTGLCLPLSAAVCTLTVPERSDDNVLIHRYNAATFSYLAKFAVFIYSHNHNNNKLNRHNITRSSLQTALTKESCLKRQYLSTSV